MAETIAPQLQKPRGRPKSAAEPGSALTAWVPASRHNQVVKAARSARVSVSEFVNHALAQTLATSKR